MEYVTLGRTGLRASVMGLGAGGPSRLGQRTGVSEEESVRVVRRALDLGVNFFDTAEAYGTETIVGKGLNGVDRSSVIISTKKGLARDGSLVPAQTFVGEIEANLRRLATDYIDIFHVHGVRPQQYTYAIDAIVPELIKLKERGTIRFLGITEAFESDTKHEMLQRALNDQVWDVMMVGFNILNQSARERVFPRTIEQNIGVLIMFAVRRALSRPERLRELMAELHAAGLVDPALYDVADPLGFLVREGGAGSLPEAAYRYCRHEPGVHVVLSGTGSVAHLEENARSLLQPPLNAPVRARLAEIFGRVDTISGS